VRDFYESLTQDTPKFYGPSFDTTRNIFERVWSWEIDSVTHCTIKVIGKSFSEQAENAIHLSMTVDQPAFVKLHEILSDNESSYIVMRLIMNGTLLQHFNHSSTLWERDAFVLLTPIFEGIYHLQNESKVAHFDLKLEHIICEDLLMWVYRVHSRHQRTWRRNTIPIHIVRLRCWSREQSQ
jgi:serine/threonine protein kinase